MEDCWLMEGERKPWPLCRTGAWGSGGTQRVACCQAPHPTETGGWFFREPNPRGFRAGNAGHGAGLGWGTGVETSDLTLEPSAPPLCPAAVTPAACGFSLRGRRRVPLRRKGSGRNSTSGQGWRGRPAPRPPSCKSPSGQQKSPLHVPRTSILFSSVAFRNLNG